MADGIASARLSAEWDEVEFAFANTKLRTLCESRKKAVEVLGPHAAREFAQFLTDLGSATTVAEFAELFPDSLVERSADERSVRMNSGHQLVFSAGHVDVPRTQAGATDWSKVSRIRFTAVEG